MQTPAKRVLGPALIVWLIFLFLYSSMLYTLESFGGNYSGFLRLRERRVDKVPFLDRDLISTLILKEQGGYDGQWYYYIAFDPFLELFKDQPQRYNEAIDAPPYRYTRIGFPLLTRLFSRGDPYAFPRTMVLLILAFNTIGAIFFLKIVQHYGKNPCWTFVYLIIPGVTACLNLGVPESMAMTVLLAGLFFYLKKRFVLSACLLSCSILIRETGILFVLILAALELFQKRSWRGAAMLCASVIPFFFWKLFLTWRLFGAYGWETLYYSPGDFTYLFGGIYDLYFNYWKTTASIPGLPFYPILVILNLVFAFILVRRGLNPFNLGLLAYSLLHLSLNHHKIWGHIRDLERTMSDGFLFLMLSFLAMSGKEKAALRYSILAAFALLFVYKTFLSPIAPAFLAGFDLRQFF